MQGREILNSKLAFLRIYPYDFVERHHIDDGYPLHDKSSTREPPKRQSGNCPSGCPARPQSFESLLTCNALGGSVGYCH
ncbi:Hypothetical protein NTJ_08970 [Nesidiocoris tenuis]|uniref:Uncharacterized protein n=1 Tax=Nesidiocoris tenuis TaxID=355587 RepID=A0ABN7AVE5_9HEMI|nr:Hypothetical protein NTJ_08970 [Nesidiocoris tenuis]